ncbi:MAG: hypothetical protein MSA27_06100, partial [Spirochaetia bacterium]|nr:hypothetical protein [Spirochaetia bacterium]
LAPQASVSTNSTIPALLSQVVWIIYIPAGKKSMGKSIIFYISVFFRQNNPGPRNLKPRACANN